jgi:unsaturated rhamnogalacturonyl hydrolase
MTSLQNQGAVTEVCPIGIIDFEKWEWPQGVGLYGLWQYQRDARRQDIRETIRGWFDRRLAEGLPERNVNTMAPMLTLAHLAEESGDPRLRSVCGEWAEWVLREMPRTREGGLQHIVTGERNEQQLWDDTLYMTVLFLGKMGVLLGRNDYIEEAVRQFLIHIKYLVDRQTGLWYHGWTFAGAHHFANALWARGNCWITAGTYDFLEMVPVGSGVRQFLLDTVAAQIRALARLQAPSGMWHTLLDDPTSYVETSATAGFGYGILKGIRLGMLDPQFRPVGQRAVAAVMERIDPDGTVVGVSYGTGMGRDLDHYRNIPLCPMAYGQALTILLLGEALKHAPVAD